jgi:hypothetical protein
LLKNSELRADIKGKTNATNAGSSRSVPSENDKLIAQHAKKFGVMNEVFMPAAALAVKRPLTDSMHVGRYHSDIAQLHGITAEVYENLPDKFYDELENSISFRHLVSSLQRGFPPLITFVLLLVSSSSN